MNKYEELFVDSRQKSYDKAMTDIAPRARDEEFKVALKYAQNHDTKTILDYPSGGGYLKNYTQGNVTEVDPAHGWDKGQSLLRFDDRVFDYVVSIAGLHHYTHLERQSLYSIFYRLVNDTGGVVIAEVEPDSNVAKYLNEFVHSHNSQGHEGIFLDQADIHALENTGFKISTTVENYKWRFDSPKQKHAYAKALFGLDKASLADIERGFEEYFNGSGADLDWSLRVFYCVK